MTQPSVEPLDYASPSAPRGSRAVAWALGVFSALAPICGGWAGYAIGFLLIGSANPLRSLNVAFLIALSLCLGGVATGVIARRYAKTRGIKGVRWVALIGISIGALSAVVIAAILCLSFYLHWMNGRSSRAGF